MTQPLLNITIPTYNRAHCVGRAIEAALRQSHPAFSVTVIDDGSQDDTGRILRRFEGDPRFGYIRLGRNVGTAQAKNVAVLLSRYDAITFHDSDDIPKDHKLLLQGRAMALSGHRADEILDWAPLGYEPGDALNVDVVVGAYELVKMNGRVFRIANRISLVDDFFPNLQFPAKTEGDWCLINAGLFRRRVFSRLGGFLDSIEEDRELRNRTVAAGAVYYFVEEPLLTKIEMEDSLTVENTTNYKAQKRIRDRNEVWRRNQLYRSGVMGRSVEEVARVEIDLSDLDIAEVHNPTLFAFANDIPCTRETAARLSPLFAGAPSSNGGEARKLNDARSISGWAL